MVSQQRAHHTHTHTHKCRNMSTLRSQMLFLIFMLNLQSLITAISAQSVRQKQERDERKKKEKQNASTRDGSEEKWQTLSSENKRNRPNLSSAPPD